MDFWSELIKTVISNGIFAILFVYLLFYQLKDSHKRENAYQETINELSDRLVMIEQVREDVSEIKDCLERREDV